MYLDECHIFMSPLHLVISASESLKATSLSYRLVVFRGNLVHLADKKVSAKRQYLYINLTSIHHTDDISRLIFTNYEEYISSYDNTDSLSQ